MAYSVKNFKIAIYFLIFPQPFREQLFKDEISSYFCCGLYLPSWIWTRKEDPHQSYLFPKKLKLKIEILENYVTNDGGRAAYLALNDC
jgi:hypothetical protein